MLKVSSNLFYHFRCLWPGMLKLPKIANLLFPWNILRKNWVKTFIFCRQISIKASYKLTQWFLCSWLSVPKVPKIASLQHLYNILKKKFESKLIFCMLVNIKVSYKLISSDTIVIDGHSHSFQSDKFAVSLQ